MAHPSRLRSLRQPAGLRSTEGYLDLPVSYRESYLLSESVHRRVYHLDGYQRVRRGRCRGQSAVGSLRWPSAVGSGRCRRLGRGCCGRRWRGRRLWALPMWVVACRGRRCRRLWRSAVGLGVDADVTVGRPHLQPVLPPSSSISRCEGPLSHPASRTRQHRGNRSRIMRRTVRPCRTTAAAITGNCFNEGILTKHDVHLQSCPSRARRPPSATPMPPCAAESPAWPARCRPRTRR